MLWFCFPGDQTGVQWCHPALRGWMVAKGQQEMRKIIYLHWGEDKLLFFFFSGQASENFLCNDGRWKGVCSVLESYWSCCCCSQMEREISCTEWEMRPQNVPQHLHSWTPWPVSRGGGKGKPAQLEMPFELIFHFPDHCFPHTLKFKTNWKYFRAVSIHSLICLIAVWQYEISSECVPFSKIIITIATHATSETQLFPTKKKTTQNQKAWTLHTALRAISEVSSPLSNHCVWKRPADVER